MSSTPKAVRRNGGNCICLDAYALGRLAEDARHGECKSGNCTAVFCLRCKGELASWGPIWCPCDNPPRWVRHPGMSQPGDYDLENDVWVPSHVALKPSIMKRRGK